MPDRHAKGWKAEGEKRIVTGKECKRLREEFEVGVSWHKKACGVPPKKRMLEDRGALPKEEGDLIRGLTVIAGVFSC